MRELCRQRFFVVDTASDFKCKIIALLDQTMLSVNTQTLTDLLHKAFRGRFGLDKALLSDSEIACGKNPSKKQIYFSHAITTSGGAIKAFNITPANVDDRTALEDLSFRQRRRIETTFSQMTEQQNAQRVLAKSFRGLSLRLLTFTTGYFRRSIVRGAPFISATSASRI